MYKRKQKKRDYGETIVDEEPKTLLERQEGIKKDT